MKDALPVDVMLRTRPELLGYAK